jgi:uncharacterized protein (DUF4415 family)
MVDVLEDLTDWARVVAITEEELEAAIANNPDADVPDLDWTRGKMVYPQPKESLHMRVDPDMLAWYKAQGRGYLTRMHAVLRTYYEAHRNKTT